MVSIIIRRSIQLRAAISVGCEAIEYETADGKWHTETAAGSDRPDTDVEDKP